MPKERIHPRHHGVNDDPHPHLQVVWNPTGWVQVGMSRDDAPTENVTRDDGTTEQRLAPLPDPNLSDTGEAILGGIVKECGVPERRLRELVARVYYDVTHNIDGRGLWTDLDRSGINRLVRVLRRARDQAYGADA